MAFRAVHRQHDNDERKDRMMHHELRYVESKAGNRHWPKVALGVLGGVLYIVAALAIMQVAFLFWIGMW